MVARLFLLASLACLLTVSYGIDCLQCVGTGASSTCETDTTANATNCVAAGTTFCTVIKVTTNNAVTGFTRGCAVADTGSACATVLGIETCTTFCNTDGCNNGDGGSGGGGAGMIRASALFLVVSAILGAALY